MFEVTLSLSLTCGILSHTEREREREVGTERDRERDRVTDPEK